MRLYLITIAVSMAAISALNIVLGVAAWYYVVAAVALHTALQFALDGAAAIAVNRMPDGWFGVDNRLFAISEAEKRLYKRLRVRTWKNRVWELGGLGGFRGCVLLRGAALSPVGRFVPLAKTERIRHEL